MRLLEKATGLRKVSKSRRTELSEGSKKNAHWISPSHLQTSKNEGTEGGVHFTGERKQLVAGARESWVRTHSVLCASRIETTASENLRRNHMCPRQLNIRAGG